MSLLKSLEAHGVSTEDLEKAASVNLFQKVAHAEGIDLTESRNKLGSLFSFNNNPTMENPMDNIEIFEKVAAAEGIDIDLLDDGELQGLYGHFLGDLEAGAYDELLADEGYYFDDGSEYDEYDDFEEKLAEADLLSDYIVESALEKLAAGSPRNYERNYGEGYTRDPDAGWFSKKRHAAQKALTDFGAYGKKSKAQRDLFEERVARRANQKGITNAVARGQLYRRRGAGRAGMALGGAGLAGAGAMALAGKRREKAASFSEFNLKEQKGKKDRAGKHTTMQALRARMRSGLHGVGVATRSQTGAKIHASNIATRVGGMNENAKKKLLKKLIAQGYLSKGTELAKADFAGALGRRSNIRRGGAIGAGAGLAAAGAGYAASQLNKNASLVEELALVKAASAYDGDYDFLEIDALSDELAEDILIDALIAEEDGYDIW